MSAPPFSFIAGDPLRALGALSIFVFHLVPAALLSAAIPPSDESLDIVLSDLGAAVVRDLKFGVYLFFALSGYLIARPFVRAFVRGERPPATVDYLRRRILRIVPAFWLVATVVLLLYGDADTVQVVTVYLVSQNLVDAGAGAVAQGHLTYAWTLHVELGFYVLVPLVTAAALRVRGRLDHVGAVRAVLALCALVATASLLLLWALEPTAQNTYHLPTNLFAFMPGVALAALEAGGAARIADGPARRISVGLVAAAVSAYVVQTALRHPSPALEGLVVMVFSGSLVAAPLVRQWGGRAPWRILDNRPLHWLGERSYSFYLVHAPLLSQLADLSFGGPRWRFLELGVVGFAVSAAVAALLYRYVEWPFLSRRRRALATSPALP